MISLILDNIRSLYNVGSAFRTADGLGVEKLYLCGYTGCPPREEISKTALGAEEVVPFEKVENILPLIKKLKEDGYTVVSLEKNNSSINIIDYRWPKNVALVVGNEIVGISEEVLKASDCVVHIPMIGIKESFNVASALAIAIYDVVSKT